MRLWTAGSLLLPGLLCAGLMLAPVSAGPAADRTLSGTLEVVWRESGDGSPCVPNYRLVSGEGSRTAVTPDGIKVSWPQWLGKSVTITGSYDTEPGAGSEGEFRGHRVAPGEAALTASDSDAQIARGVKPYLTILCRFADSKRKTPKPASYFQRLISDRKSGLISYFRQSSYGGLNLEGSRCVGWANLPRALSAYRPGSSFDLDLALGDAVELAARQVSITDFAGINLVFNVPA